jgi:Ferritin-like
MPEETGNAQTPATSRSGLGSKFALLRGPERRGSHTAPKMRSGSVDYSVSQFCFSVLFLSNIVRTGGGHKTSRVSRLYWREHAMQVSISRHLGSLIEKRGASARAALTALVKAPIAPPEFNPLDYVSFLLNVDAEIEHSLMVQYLYAAYSLGGPQVPEEHWNRIRGWQEVVLGIAKEEMGHLISVQNVLRLIGAPLNFARDDYPSDTLFYSYPFALEPLTPSVLAKYVFVESPTDWSGPDADAVKKLLPSTATPTYSVSKLFAELIGLVKHPDFLPDDAFQSETWPYQAKWDEWGRGYKGGARGNAEGVAPADTPDLLVEAVASRDDAVRSLKKIAEQGEANPDPDTTSPSHFARFLKIFKDMEKLQPTWTKQKWTPWRNVAENPYIPAAGASSRGKHRDVITHPEAVLWAHLFNVRYRMVLAYLTHSFDLDGGLNETAPWSPRGTLISATFGEMYNMRAIATFLVQTPLSKKANKEGKFAGPPFQMPYTLARPAGEVNRWRLHCNLLSASAPLIADLLKLSDPSRHRYLHSLCEADQKLLDVIDHILAGQTNLSRR